MFTKQLLRITITFAVAALAVVATSGCVATLPKPVTPAPPMTQAELAAADAIYKRERAEQIKAAQAKAVVEKAAADRTAKLEAACKSLSPQKLQNLIEVRQNIAALRCTIASGQLKTTAILGIATQPKAVPDRSVVEGAVDYQGPGDNASEFLVGASINTPLGPMASKAWAKLTFKTPQAKDAWAKGAHRGIYTTVFGTYVGNSTVVLTNGFGARTNRVVPIIEVFFVPAQELSQEYFVAAEEELLKTASAPAAAVQATTKGSSSAAAAAAPQSGKGSAGKAKK